MITLGVHPGNHDAAAAVFDGYRLIAAVALERLSRRKGDGGGIPDAAIDEVLSLAGLERREVDAVALTRTRLPWRFYTHFRGGRLIEGKVRGLLGTQKQKDLFLELRRSGRSRGEDIVDLDRLRGHLGVRPDALVHFANHHRAHALSALFFTDWEQALVYTADGGGDHLHYSAYVLKDGRLDTLWGDDAALHEPIPVDSLGLAYGYATEALGYRINRHEGKLTGLAAYGTSRLHDALTERFRVDPHGRVSSDYESYQAMRRHIFALAEHAEPADVAASVQHLLESCISVSVDRIFAERRPRHLALAGGVFANVRLNRLLAESGAFNDVFVFPAMGDDGLAVGAALSLLLERDGLATWLDRRYRLADVYLGREHGDAIDRVLAAAPGIRQVSADPVAETVARLRRGQAGALYTGRMEFGPRALGARSILAAPDDATINDRLNKRLQRTEFMPFAPVVADADAGEVFDLPAVSRYAARFMTITCAVKPAWRDRIPAVVHVDGTARPQTVERAANPLYFDILAGYKAATGLPVLINTSFNVHEEPIVNTPAECLQALSDDRVDFVVTRGGVFVHEGARARP